MRRPAKSVAVAATLAAALLWGTSFAVNDLALSVVDPFSFVFLRFAIAAVTLLGLSALTGPLEARLALSPRMWLLGALNAAGFLGQTVGQCWTTPARTALFVNSNVFLVAALSFWLHRERFGRGKLVAVAAAFGGVALLSLQQGQPGACGAAWFGDAIVFAGAVAWSLFIVLNQGAASAGASRVTNIVAWTFVSTTVWLAPFLALSDAPLRVPVPEGWPVLYAALVTTVLTYLLWTFGLQSVSATVSAVLILSEVLVAVAITLALGRESFTTTSLVGGLVLFGSIAYVSVAQARQEEPVASRERGAEAVREE